MTHEKPPQKKSSLLLRVLIPTLAILAVALAFDRVSRKNWDDSYHAVEKLLPSDSEYGLVALEDKKTASDVHAIVGRKPVDVEVKDDWYRIEHYQWRGGLPWRTYDLYVSYYTDERLTIHDISQVRDFPMPAPEVNKNTIAPEDLILPPGPSLNP